MSFIHTHSAPSAPTGYSEAWASRARCVASVHVGTVPSRAAQSGLDYLAEAATSVSAVDWDTDGRGVRPTTRQQQQAPARPTTQVQMEARPVPRLY